MGVFDTYAGCQIKVGVPFVRIMHKYEVGDKVLIPDGIYITLDGIIVIKNGILVAANEKIYDKWGNEIDQERIIDLIKQNNPVQIAMDEFKKTHNQE